ncbi:MAG: hypothetical protein M1404_01680 [Acidobacteria bacterium]|nr:hypothetical protein [Acidobacteriota bacterium]
MKLADISWRDCLQLLNSILFCLLGILMIGRYFSGRFPAMLAALGIVFLIFGGYRLGLARKELRKRGSGRL